MSYGEDIKVASMYDLLIFQELKVTEVAERYFRVEADEKKMD